ncbi:ATP-dependent zinc metalloprotease FtsH [Prochlorococcus marinus]|uniref:ATP-dependent zinc metalloprotease FtsH n=1 Tax=Prochlorococcus marinus TaxID=1219 RepID=UPI0022B43976|nr:ATP-dependent zinc metalloprotease FtsH [Prochlorococcus marinus]
MSKSYSQLLKDIESGEIISIILIPNRREVIVEFINGDQKLIPIFYNDQKILRMSNEYNVPLTVKDIRSDKQLANFITGFGLVLIFTLSLSFLIRRSSKLLNNMQSFSRRSSQVKEDDIRKYTFDDVAGLNEESDELKEIVTFLKHPQLLIDLGAKTPKGVLLVGAPGTGKTLLARAIAGEANVPFFSISASEFVEMFVGVGAGRVRDLFNTAKLKSPCIVFIDEIDSIGRQRGAGIGGGNDEREQTLNQLLTEMDGFETNNGVIVIAATNRPDILDEALTRPGRFDRRIDIFLPDRKARHKILSVHARTKPLSDSVNLAEWASKTPGFSGADLQNLLNEAAIYAARNDKSSISNIELDKALEKARFGLLSKPLTDSTKKRQIAYQIIGKTLVALLIPTQDKLEKVSLFKSLSDISGTTYFTPNEETIDSGLLTRDYIFNKIVISLGSRAAEIIVFGSKEVTQGSQKDLENVYFWANQMVTKFGFSDLGPIAFDSEKNSIFLGKDIMKNRKEYSQKTSMEIDKQIISIANKGINKAIKLLENKVDLMDILVDELILNESLESEYIISTLNSYVADN